MHASHMIVSGIAAFGASFIFVALKAGQQLNVVHNNYVMVIPTSFAMATCEVLVVANMAKYGWGWIILPIGLGSGLGAVCSMYLHGKMRTRLAKS